MEQLVAVHTREFRPIRESRQHFLAPDPQDLPDVNARLTRNERELDNYSTAMLTVMETGVTQLAQVDDTEDETEDVSVGLTIHHNVYDYWCPYCDCWHPSCTHDHCWCGWEVMHHYHGYYHYNHCFLWDGWHPWWRPPVVYIYIQGGSPWDYDTRPWRTRQVWAERRHYSDRWRSLETPRIEDRESWSQPPKRHSSDKPDFINLKRRLDESQDKPAPRAPSILSTEPGSADTPQGNLRPRPSVLSTGGVDENPLRPVPPSTPAEKAKPTPSTQSKGKGKGKKGKTPAVSTGGSSKPESKPEAKPESKPETKPESKPDAKPERKPDKPKPAKPKRLS